MTLEQLTKKARKQYTHYLKYTIPNRPEFDDPICYNGQLGKLLDSSFSRWLNLKTKQHED